jgi:adenosine deaminase
MRAAHQLGDETLAELAAMSVRASCAPEETKAVLLADVADWLTPEPVSATMTS